MGIANIVCKYLVKNIFSNFLKKYLRKRFPIPKCCTILESWDQMPSHGFDKNLIWSFFFQHPKEGHFGFSKMVFTITGGNFSNKKFYVSRSLSNMSKNGLRMVVRLNFDITHLSPPSTTNIPIVSKNMVSMHFACIFWQNDFWT